MRHDDWTAPLLMTAFALPAYLAPLPGMMRLGLMFEHGNSVGAAFVLFELGIGVNLGLIVWLMYLFGWRRILLWLGLIVGVTLGLAYASERLLYFAHEEAPHTHAFDEWTSPFVSGSEASGAVVREKLLQKVEILEPVALGGLGLLVLVGLGLQKFDRQGRFEAWLLQPPPPSTGPVSFLNRDVPGPVLGLVALGGLIAFSVVALYIYYPRPQAAFRDMAQVRAEALIAVSRWVDTRNTGQKEEGIRQIQYWDLLTRKLQVGAFIRTGRMDPEATKVTEDLRERLEDLRDALLADNLTEAKGLVDKVEQAYRKCRDCYQASLGKSVQTPRP
jgi:hypothetical protein